MKYGRGFRYIINIVICKTKLENNNFTRCKTKDKYNQMQKTNKNLRVMEFGCIKRGKAIFSGSKHYIRYFFPEPKEFYSNVFHSQKLIKISHTIPRKYSLKVAFTEKEILYQQLLPKEEFIALSEK